MTEMAYKLKELYDTIRSIPEGPVVVDVTVLRALTNHTDGLRDALEDARDHLEYCGYGDAWERECAEAQGLSEKIDRALELPK